MAISNSMITTVGSHGCIIKQDIICHTLCPKINGPICPTWNDKNGKAANNFIIVLLKAYVLFKCIIYFAANHAIFFDIVAQNLVFL